MRLSFFGAAHEVTGSCHLLEACGKNILIDCGMEQGPDLYENQELPVTPGEVDYILLTHAHMDHREIFRYWLKRDFPERSLQHLQRQICAISCCVTVPIFRNLRRNGETGRQDEVGNRNTNRFIRLQMQMRRPSFWHLWITVRRLHCVTE